MDILSLVSNEKMMEFTENLDYGVGDFMGTKLFPKQKTSDVILTIKRLVEYGNLPVMAQVHGYDTEAVIGSRVNFEELRIEPLLIKEKLCLSERVKHYLGKNPTNTEVEKFIYDDANTLVVRNLTRHEVANMELLCTGQVTVKENNVDTVVDYGMPAGNKITFHQWQLDTTNIIADLEQMQELAKKKGYTIVRAITSSKMIGYMLKNKAIRAYWATSVTPLTQKALLSWLNDNYGIEFVTNDARYKTSAQASTAYRFFDEDTISFLTTKTALGQGLYGVTPEQEKMFPNGNVYEKSLVTIMQWEEDDPCSAWTKGSSVYIPVIKDINGLFIAKHSTEAAAG